MSPEDAPVNSNINRDGTLLEWLGLSRFSSRLNIARICKGSSRTEGVR